ncbi:MAG: radical SAM protein [Planctomycetota bacterium]
MKKLNILFANLNGNLYADGSRILSSILKKMGHHVHMYFLIEREDVYYSEYTLDQFTQHCAGADLILLSFLSDGFLRAARLTRYVRERLNIPVIWGGLQATIDPEACMEYVDILCRGEGEEALPELVSCVAEGKPYHQVPNFWVRRNGEIHKNAMRPLQQDLNSNPWPDYDIEDHFVRDDDNRIKPMTVELLAKYHITMPLGFYNYAASTARGCAQFCSYCYNSTFKSMFKGQRRVRFRDMENVVNEIRSMLDRFPFFTSFSFADDDLFMRSKSDLARLSELIHEKLSDAITRSFWSCAATPAFLNEEKLDILYGAGLRAVMIGVQTGSERMNMEVYNRRFKNELLYEKTEIIDRKYHKKLIILLDFIVHCPYETHEDVFETVKMLCLIPNWFVPSIYRFTFYPGTPIYEQAIRDGIITRDPAVYSGWQFYPFYYKGYSLMTQTLFLIAASNYILPSWVKRLLCSKWLRSIGRKIPQKILDLIPWNKIYQKLWAANHRAIYKGILNK